MVNFFFLFCFHVSLLAHGLQNDPEVLLEKHFQAAGQELWNQINTVTVDGRWVDENYYGRNIKLTFKAPNKIRIQGQYDGQTFVEAHNGVVGWLVAPWKIRKEPRKMDEQEELIIKNSFSLGSPLYPVRDQITYGGLEDMEGVLYHTFRYVDDQVSKKYFIDRDDHNLYYEEIELKSNARRILKIYEAYRNYNQLSLPTAVRFESEGLDKELVFDQVYLGLGAKDEIFNAPAGN